MFVDSEQCRNTQFACLIFVSSRLNHLILSARARACLAERHASASDREGAMRQVNYPTSTAFFHPLNKNHVFAARYTRLRRRGWRHPLRSRILLRSSPGLLLRAKGNEYYRARPSQSTSSPSTNTSTTTILSE